MASIKVLRDYNGTAVYPQTVTSAIYSTDNQTLDAILSSKATKEEVDNRFNNFSSLDIQVVSELPAEGSSTSIYLLQTAGGVTGNLYEEYLYVNNKWEMIGAKEVDLSEYAKIVDIPANEEDPTVPNHVKTITEENISNWNNKAETNAIPNITSQSTDLEAGVSELATGHIVLVYEE